MRTIKAIDTHYRGRWFRSRLEASWAYWFDIVGLAWEYEIVGYSTGNIRYLPDFTFPLAGIMLEVKPHNVPAKEEARLEAIREALDECNQPFWILRGVPDADNHRLYLPHMGEAGRFMRCRRCSGVCVVGLDETFMTDIHPHTCGDHDRWPVDEFRTEFRKAQRHKFDHFTKEPE